MAIWQFDFNIIPKVHGTENIISWMGETINEEAFQSLEQVLKPHKSWSQDITQFGKDDETCVKILKEKDKIDEISCRLDLRTLKKEELQNILKFINQLNAEILYLEKAYSASMPVCLNLIKNSNAIKFCQNPVGFLESLK